MLDRRHAFAVVQNLTHYLFQIYSMCICPILDFDLLQWLVLKCGEQT